VIGLLGQSAVWRRLAFWGTLMLMGLLGWAGCGPIAPPTAAPTTPSAQPSPTRRLEVSPSPRPTVTSPTAEVTVVLPTTAPTLGPTATSAATPEPAFFGGECAPEVHDLCLRSWTWVTWHNERVLRYIFFHARYPAYLKVRINGMQLICAPLPERAQDQAVVCYGKPLGSLRGVVRLRFAYFLPDGRVIEGQVPQEVRPMLRYIFPVWFPPTPTPEE